MILFLSILFIVFIGLPTWYLLDAWYVNKYYKTKDHTDKHEKGWSKCYYCGLAESPIYYFHKWYHLNRRYHCGKCDKPEGV